MTDISISERIQQIATAPAEERHPLFAQLRRQVLENGAGRKARILLPLLYDGDAEIRREAAYLISDFQVRLTREEEYRLWLALQDIDRLKAAAENDDLARTILFDALTDRNLRLRNRLLASLHLRDCRCPREKALYHYGRADFEQLQQLFSDDIEAQSFIEELLKRGTEKGNNVPWMRRQCAQCLESLLGMRNIAGELRQLLDKKTVSSSGEKLASPTAPKTDKDPHGAVLPGLNVLLHKLGQAGLNIDGVQLYPQVYCGPANGRILYKNPAPQTWPKEKRHTSIWPPKDYQWLRFDYKAMEPSLLLHFLLKEQWLSLSDIPVGDIYDSIGTGERSEVKRYLNSLINGGQVMPPFNPRPFLWKLLPALDNLRSDLRERYQGNEELFTLGGRPLLLKDKKHNPDGRLMNRLIQGSAADFFNSALIVLDKGLSAAHLDARIGFVLYDEVWLAVKPFARDTVLSVAGKILNEHYKKLNLLWPLRVRAEEGKDEPDGDK